MVVAAGGNTEMLRMGMGCMGRRGDGPRSEQQVTPLCLVTDGAVLLGHTGDTGFDGMCARAGQLCAAGRCSPPGDRQMDGWTDGAWCEPR